MYLIPGLVDDTATEILSHCWEYDLFMWYSVCKLWYNTLPLKIKYIHPVIGTILPPTAIKRLKNLRQLSLRLNNMIDMAIIPINVRHTLTNLDLSRNNTITNIDLILFKNLTKLYLDHTSNINGYILTKLPKLASLKLSGAKNITNINQLTGLTTLDITGYIVDNDNLSQLTGLKKLKLALNTSNGSFIQELTGLTSLTVSACAIQGPYLESLTKLKHLSISVIPFIQDNNLVKLSNLQSLSLFYTEKISPSIFESLTNLQTIKFTTERCNIKPDDIPNNYQITIKDKVYTCKLQS